MIPDRTKLGRYEIRSQLGVGGMGEVYLAEDTKLDRKVALKILPAELAAKQERMTRFVREAKAAAALNHPNIAHVYEIDEANGQHFIAMEFIDGATLREKIHRDHTELRKLLRYLQHVAEGLAKAHAAGIVHRDLKPDNIMISRDGYAKILDFGLAKLVEPTVSMSQPTDGLSEVATAVMPQHSLPGTVMGTVGYMSPEQAQGKINEIDHRSDIFSFGCILFEAITGQKTFDGKDTIDSLNKTIREPAPPISSLNAGAPSDLQRIVRRCLAKDRDERYQSIKDVAIELKEVVSELTDGVGFGTTAPPASLTGSSQHRAETLSSQMGSALSNSARDSSLTAPFSAEYVFSQIKQHKIGTALALAALAAVIAGAGFGLYKLVNRSQPKGAPSLSQMRLTRLTTTGKATVAAISPDGKYVVYAMNDNGQQSLWMRQTAMQSNVQIVPPAADVNYARLMFSPDGNYLFYTAAAERNVDTATLYQIPVLGGSPKKLLSNISHYMALSPDASQIVFKRAFPAESIDALMIQNTDGTNERRLAVRKMPDRYFEVGVTQSAPAWSPDGKTIACTVTNVDGGVIHNGLAAIDVGSGRETTLTSRKFYTMGQLAWLNEGSGLLMLAADELNGRAQLWHLSYPEGEARRVTNDLNYYRTISLTADSNNLVTVQLQGTGSIWIAPANDIARARQITNGAGSADFTGNWTPDNRIVFASNASGSPNVWKMDADGGNQKQLTTEGGTDPSVSPDGSYIVFVSSRTGAAHIFRMDADGGNVKQLTNGSGEFDPSFSSDGKWVLYSSRQSGKITLWRVFFDGGERQQLTDKYSYRASASPDGKWLAAYYREDTPNSPDKIALFPFEGGQPVKTFDNIPTRDQRINWTPDSRALVYIITRGGVSNLWTQPIDGEPKQITDFKGERIFSFTYSRDGKQFVLSRGTINSDVVLISNFK